MVSTRSLHVLAIRAILAAQERVARSGIHGGVDALYDGLPRPLDAGVWSEVNSSTTACEHNRTTPYLPPFNSGFA
jgi:hypothetical protein